MRHEQRWCRLELYAWPFVFLYDEVLCLRLGRIFAYACDVATSTAVEGEAAYSLEGVKQDVVLLLQRPANPVPRKSQRPSLLLSRSSAFGDMCMLLL